jgi:DNA-binding Lrp family transcriptional regulator
MPLAFVFINCLPDQLTGVERKVERVVGVVESYSTSGIYDMLLKIKAENEAALRDIIISVKRITGIASTITSIAYKEDGGQ